MDTRKVLTGIFVVTFIGAVAVAFSYIGTPAYNKRLAEDELRVDDIYQLRDEVDSYYYSNKCKIPAGLKEAHERNTEYRRKLNFPIEQYKLNVSSASSKYKICTKFNEAYAQGDSNRMSHKAGYDCYEFDSFVTYRSCDGK